MKNKIPCELIQDLLPSYIDKMTNDVTSEQIKEHIEECGDCRDMLERMQEPTVEPMTSENKLEIDFLKKTRKKTNNIMFGSIIAAVAVIVFVLFAKFYLIGNYMSSDFILYDVSIDGNVLTLSGSALDDSLSIRSAEFLDDNGIIKVSFKVVQASPFNKGSFEEQYKASEDIVEVWIDERIVWSHGQNISAMTAAVYNARHLYIGDMSANGKSAKALNIGNYLGNFKNELQTSEKPYSWNMILQNTFSHERQETMEEIMKSYAYILLATIDNLGEVSFEYHLVDGKACDITVTELEATEFAGENIKEIGQDIKKLQNFMIKMGLTSMSYVSDGSQRNNEDVIKVNVISRTDMDIRSMGVSRYVDGVLIGTQGTQHADGTFIMNGQVESFTFIPDDFGIDELKGTEELMLEVMISDKDGRNYTTVNSIKIAPELGLTYSFELSGDKESGFIVSQ